tara:strand:+ start:1070 stop:1264 length:195 start_codon:yes stop_codon:yes gene_type:complete
MKKQYNIGEMVEINVPGDSIWTLAVCTKAYAGLSYGCYIVETGETIRLTTQSIREVKHNEETTI